MHSYAFIGGQGVGNGFKVPALPDLEARLTAAGAQRSCVNGSPQQATTRNPTSMLTRSPTAVPTAVPSAVPTRMSIPALASSLPQFSTLVSLLTAADLVGAVSGGSLTVFAPTNDAFAKLPEALVSFLTKPENKQTLVRCLA